MEKMEQSTTEKCGDSGNGYCCHGIRHFKKSITAAVILLSVFLLAKSVNEFKRTGTIGSEIAPQTTINVTGKGEVVAVPDIATFSFSVTKESLSIEEAQTEATKANNDIMAFLKKSGIDEKDIKTTGYNIYPRYEYSGSSSYYQSGKRTLAAYVVSHSVTVKVRKISDSGKILSSLAELGATDVSGLTFGFDKDDDLRASARAKAIDDAKAKAKVLARDLGVALVRVISFNEGGGYPVYGYAGAMSAAPMGKGGGPAPEISVGEDKITSNVSITYEIR
jgi:uncharacterized protein YggE